MQHVELQEQLLPAGAESALLALGPDQGDLDLQVVRLYFDLLLTTSTEIVPDVAHWAALFENATLIQHLDLIVQIVFAAFPWLRNQLS